jgi:hypothetical protein
MSFLPFIGLKIILLEYEIVVIRLHAYAFNSLVKWINPLSYHIWYKALVKLESFEYPLVKLLVTKCLIPGVFFDSYGCNRDLFVTAIAALVAMEI